MDLREEALVSLRAAYPEWTFELDGRAISARLAPSRHLVLGIGIAAWKGRVISWPNGPALLDQLGEYVASSPDEVRCMAALLKAIAAAEGAAASGASGVADAPDDGLAHDDWEVPPAAVVLINEMLQGQAVDIADLRGHLADALRERDEARAELERVKATLDGFYLRMIAPQAQVTVGIEHQIEKNASAKRFNAEVLTTLAAAASSLESLACNARLALFAGYDPIEVFSEVAGLATHLARRVADGTLPGEVPQASDVVVFACELDALALASMTRWQAELASWQARELPCDDAGEQRWRLYAGVQEELGEVARCLLKGSQGIRGGAEVWRAQLPGEIGDVLVYLTQLATACGVDLGAAYAEARAKVLARRFATAEVPK